jgi:hypothetical protein
MQDKRTVRYSAGREISREYRAFQIIPPVLDAVLPYRDTDNRNIRQNSGAAMGDPRGFLKVKRKVSGYQPVEERVNDYSERKTVPFFM